MKESLILILSIASFLPWIVIKFFLRVLIMKWDHSLIQIMKWLPLAQLKLGDMVASKLSQNSKGREVVRLSQNPRMKEQKTKKIKKVEHYSVIFQ